MPVPIVAIIASRRYSGIDHRVLARDASKIDDKNKNTLMIVEGLMVRMCSKCESNAKTIPDSVVQVIAAIDSVVAGVDANDRAPRMSI